MRGVINIEVKSRLRDRSALEVRLLALGAQEEWRRRQVDTFWRVERGWMKLREEAGRAELITYVRDQGSSAPRPSDYDVLPVDDVPAWKRALGRVLDVEAVVEKERTLWLWSHTRVHLDRVDGLGDFVELETVSRGISVTEAEAEAAHVVRELALERSDFIPSPYKVLLEQRGAEGAVS